MKKSTTWAVLAVLFAISAGFHLLGGFVDMEQGKSDQRCATVCSAEYGKVTEGAVRDDKCYCLLLSKSEPEWKP